MDNYSHANHDMALIILMIILGGFAVTIIWRLTEGQLLLVQVQFLLCTNIYTCINVSGITKHIVILKSLQSILSICKTPALNLQNCLIFKELNGSLINDQLKILVFQKRKRIGTGYFKQVWLFSSDPPLKLTGDQMPNYCTYFAQEMGDDLLWHSCIFSTCYPWPNPLYMTKRIYRNNFHSIQTEITSEDKMLW